MRPAPSRSPSDPDTEGNKSGTLRVPSNASNGNVNVPLTGTGTAAPADVSLSPTSYDYGSVEFATLKHKTFTFANEGGTSVHVVSVEKSAGSSKFTIPSAEDGCSGADVGAGESCTFRVTFTAPTTSDTKNATIEVSGSGFSPVTAAVTGKGVPFVAKVDGYITKEPENSGYVGQGIFCASHCSAQTVAKTVQKGKTYTYRIKLKNVGNGRDGIKAKLSQGGSKAIIESITVLRDGNVDVTSQFLNAGYTIRNLNPGSYAYFWVKVKLTSNATSGNTNGVIITAASLRNSAVKDVIRANTTVQ